MPYRLAMAQKPYYAKRVPQNAGLLRCFTMKGGYRDSNPGPPEPQSGAITNFAIPTIFCFRSFQIRMSLKGFEPPTHGLEGRCSIQLSYRLTSLNLPKKIGKQVMGIEPTYLAWKASVLPLNYTRISYSYSAVLHQRR